VAVVRVVAGYKVRWQERRRSGAFRRPALVPGFSRVRSPRSPHRLLLSASRLTLVLSRGRTDAADLLPDAALDPAWPWPEPRLSYANALIPEARLAVAVARCDREGATNAVSLLDWLVRAESRERRFSFTPVAGRGPGEPKPAFDQQPIEAWAMADACARAYTYRRSPLGRRGRAGGRLVRGR